jgi:hypothetical protein
MFLLSYVSFNRRSRKLFITTLNELSAIAAPAIPVTGMTCAACQSFVQKMLAGQPGVKDASVNLMLHLLRLRSGVNSRKRPRLPDLLLLF